MISSFSKDDNYSDKNWVAIRTEAGRKTSRCKNEKLLGGYNVAGKHAKFYRRYSNLETAKKITIAFRAYAIDSWDRNERF